MKVLITGAQGFVGRYLTAELLGSDPAAVIVGTGRSPECAGFFSHELTGCDRAPLPASLQPAPHDRYRYVRADLLDEEAMYAVISDFAPDGIVHLASGLRDDSHRELVRSNVEGTTVLMSAIISSGLQPTLVLGSSGGVYGRVAAEHLPIAESMPTDPADVYAGTKLAAEQIGRIAGRNHHFPVVAARIFNIVGAGQDERHVCGRFARELHRLVRTGGTDLSVGALETTRDFVDVRDVARALVLLARCGVADSVYNVASGIETAVGDVLERLAAIAGYRGGWTVSPSHSRQSDVPRHWAEISRLRALGFAPRHSLAASLKEVYAYARDRDRTASTGP